MIRFGHCSLIAADSTIGIKRLKYPLFTILLFDTRQHALPVAWAMTRSFAKSDMSKWLKALMDRAHSADPGWKISGFLIDDAAAEIDTIRDIFCSSVLFSLRCLHRSWLRNIVKKCSNIEVQREIFKCLGNVVYSIWEGGNTSIAVEEFIQDFVDQTHFMEYFSAFWVPKIGMWLSTMRTLPLASKEASGAIEAYHVKLKAILFDDSHLGALKRIDWLVHKLTTELHSSYWLDRYADESDSFQNIKEEYISSTSWHPALQIPDSPISLDDKDHLFAKVVSQKDSNVTHLAWILDQNLHFVTALGQCKLIFASMSSRFVKVFKSFKEILMNLWSKPMDGSVSLDQSMAWTYQMLDQIQKLIELNASSDISIVVNKMPLEWVSKKDRTHVGKPSSTVSLPLDSSTAKNFVAHRKSQKQKIVSVKITWRMHIGFISQHPQLLPINHQHFQFPTASLLRYSSGFSWILRWPSSFQDLRQSFLSILHLL